MIKILVIEDDKQVQENIQVILELEDFDVIVARDGQSGLEKAIASSPDLILCDIMMPQMDGFEVLSALQSIEATSNIPFIFLTAKSDRDDLRQGMELGADDYLTKPFTPKELLKAIQIRLDKKEKYQQKYTQTIQEISEQVEHQLHYDQVTELPNRLSLREQFNQRLAQSQFIASNTQMLPIFCLSLDRFNQIQKNLGYNFSDQLLKAFVERVKKSLDPKIFLAYLGSNEFAMILPIVEYKTFIFDLANHIKTQLNQPFTVNNQEVFLSVSIGIALYEKDAQDIEKILQKAKKAMYKVQENGGNDCEFYSWVLDVHTSRRQRLENDLHYAIERGELSVHYQPQVSLKTGKIIGCEALARWSHPTYNMIAPDVFIPIAEEIGLIDKIGEWVLDQACKELKKWQSCGFLSFKMAVNISVCQLNKANFRQKSINTLLASNILPKYIEFELTESCLVQDLVMAKQKIEALNSLDIRVSIDDFGTGYSSLKSLQNLPFNTLKIDRSFIQDVDSNPSNSAITSNLIKIAHSLGLKVVAEGVETAGELNFLKQHQCDAIQGFIFSYPLPASEMTNLLREGKCLKIQEPLE
ncbi:EAL domain-containing response regulator [Lyngbya sp. PCC 8106]|uniref:EAL domain-containing response regulator n=1 Tax=Lyngbya sp. (strain PCC 8106) TaxID=313612 RepID=UPI0000EACC19|nr:EAL domain-containing response regulator [Lyngbya sp. PCC 8106]EAW37975.1 Hybrid signal transduction histidine kinase and diguanylatecyclase/phosphodiesterase [Lyngbya sp. PCC 8106]